MSIRNALTAAVAVLAIGAAAPALAQGTGSGSGSGGNGSAGAGDTNIENFVRQSPDGMAPTSNGTPRIIDNRDGQPVIQYSGPRGAGVQDGGTPRIIDNRDGQPVISYGGQVPGDTSSTDSSAMQEAASQNRARPGMRGTPAANASNAAVASQVRPLLNSARTSLQRGRYAAAASSLEQAETHMLNSGVDRADMRPISEARVAAQRGDRNSALQLLDSVMR
ncbi:hypothetical protein EBE87_12290 [Pseudoroseomonas wenyumeiae]|uniref:Uncharacterized protein n=1 Tax=Teichococcus wenyumeiae TaxID=2478470 RepID=A0A3A9JSS5_9PROT|nr:hypothetical protein [Pseudoroseomonas wenyumeiae]RKK02009.1 hypothetical protein D6Z83_22025 [Pseudoroseomonas wenyumeiae]RMI24470.1 hypothetical protein EBE87_12290 [Pseudoroseomonas wenyumeiae]